MLLTLPFVAAVLALSLVVAVLSYRAGMQAVEAAARSWLAEAVQRVAQDLRRSPGAALAQDIGASRPSAPPRELLPPTPAPARAWLVVIDRDGRAVRWRGPGARVAVLPAVASAADAEAPAWALRHAAALARLSPGTVDRPHLSWVEPPGGEALLTAVARLDDALGPAVAVMAAVPRADLVAGLEANAAHTAAVALVAVAVVLLVGAAVRSRVAADALELARSAQRIGEGDLDAPPGPMASRELDALRDALKQLQRRLRTDRGTGLANRESVLARLHDRVRHGRRRNDAPLLALLFVDLDRFERVNARHGREAGDVVLQAIGRRLRQTVRDTDLVARWSGDEFVLLLDGVGSPENAQRVRDQVERVLRDPVELGEGRDAAELDGTAGLALWPGDASEPDALIRAAAQDMVRRKPAPQGRR
jgi:diguanylate cyclase (GGDEF)-like protein